MRLDIVVSASKLGHEEALPLLVGSKYLLKARGILCQQALEKTSQVQSPPTIGEGSLPGENDTVAIRGKSFNAISVIQADTDLSRQLKIQNSNNSRSAKSSLGTGAVKQKSVKFKFESFKFSSTADGCS